MEMTKVSTDKEKEALKKAHKEISDAGYTPCKVANYVYNGNVYAFSAGVAPNTCGHPNYTAVVKV